MGDSSYCATAFCVFFYSLPWAITFGVKIAITDESECEGPAWTWVNIGLIYFIWTSIGCIAYVVMKFFQDVIDKKVANVLLSISFLPLIFSAPMIIGLIIAYGRRTECPPFETILLIWFILTMVILAIPFLILSLSFYCGCTAYLADQFGQRDKQISDATKDTNMIELKVSLN